MKKIKEAFAILVVLILIIVIGKYQSTIKEVIDVIGQIGQFLLRFLIGIIDVFQTIINFILRLFGI